MCYFLKIKSQTIYFHKTNILHGDRQMNKKCFMVKTYDPKTFKQTTWRNITEKEAEKHYHAEDKAGYPVKMFKLTDYQVPFFESWKEIKNNGISWLPFFEHKGN